MPSLHCTLAHSCCSLLSLCGSVPRLALLLRSLLVVTTLYVVGGCVFKHKKQGTQGMESCPNVDFWRALPGLVKDGCVFFFQLCKKLVAKCRGQNQSGSGYNDMK